MAVTLEANARNAAADGVVDLLDGGSVEFQTAASAVASTVTLQTPAFGAASAGVATMNGTPNDASATGDGDAVTKAIWDTSGAAKVFECTVSNSAGSGDIKFSTTDDVIDPGDDVTLSSFTYTQPAS